MKLSFEPFIHLGERSSTPVSVTLPLSVHSDSSPHSGGGVQSSGRRDVVKSFKTCFTLALSFKKKKSPFYSTF